MKSKRFIRGFFSVAIACLFVCFTFQPTKTEALLQVGVYGDVDGDGKVTARDALTTLKYVANIIKFTDEQYTKADFDGNLIVNAEDALLILKKVAKLI